MSPFKRIVRVLPILLLIGVATLPLRAALAANDRRCFAAFGRPSAAWRFLDIRSRRHGPK